MIKKNWENFFKDKNQIKKFGKHKFDYSNPDKDIIQLVSKLKSMGVKKILDLGCGEGRNTRFLAKHSFKMYGLDISKHAILKAKSQNNGNINYTIGNMKNMLYGNDYFDATISIQTIFHENSFNIRKTIKEIKRVNKNNALIFITLQPISGNEYRMGQKIETGTYISNTGDDKGEVHHFYTEQEIRQDFSDFKVMELHLDADRNYWYLLMTNNK